MKQLAYLLQDIDDDDRQDALGYYQDYFDEAGSEHETDIINELGSPERVASIVRTSLHSNPDGIIWLFIHPLQGIFTAGAGLTALGAGFLLLALCLLFYGRLIPRLVCSIIEWISSLLHKGRCKR